MSEPIGQIELSIVKGHTSGLFVLSDTGVTIADDTSFEQWNEGLKFIKWAKTKLTIGLADYIAFGERKFGAEKVGQSLEQLEFESTMVKAAIAINSVPQELRLPGLTGDHYVELSKADKEKQSEWAQIASDQALTPTQLKFSIAEGEVVDKAASRALSSGVVTIHGIRQQFDVWLNRVGGLDGVVKMEPDFRDEILGELDAILKFGSELHERLSVEAAA